MRVELLRNGRRAAIFLFFLCSWVACAQELTISQDVMVSRGLLDNYYWKNQPLQSTSNRVVAYTDVGVRVEWPLLSHAISYERKTLNTLVSNSNTLALAAKDGAYSSQVANGGVDLQAHTKRYQFDALGMKFAGAAENNSWRWFISPKWVRLLDVREGDGSGVLTKDDTTLSLHGDMQRIGMTAYGFQADPATPRLMNGGSVDVGLAWASGAWKFNATAQHLYSKIPAQSLYFSNRDYNVNATTAQGITYSNVPSLSGTYGQRDMSLSLPRIVKVDVSYKSRLAGTWLKTGIVSVDGRNVPWLGLMFPVEGHEFELRNYELNNTQLTYRTPSILKGHLSGEFMMIRDSSGNQKSLVGGIRLNF